MFEYQLPVDGNASVTIHNSAGEKVAVFHQGRRTRGVHVVTWSPGNATPGVYDCRLRADGVDQTRFIRLIRMELT